MCHHGVPSYVLSLCNTTLDTTVETWKSLIGNLEAIIWHEFLSFSCEVFQFVFAKCICTVCFSSDSQIETDH
jgi:hypothetical protein